jgi:hypothetical protein
MIGIERFREKNVIRMFLSLRPFAVHGAQEWGGFHFSINGESVLFPRELSAE